MPPVYERKDHYYKKAKKQGLASRAVYKLEEIDREFKLIQPGSRVVDLGCAPGGWLQFLAKKVGAQGKIVGIDLLEVKAPLPPYIRIVQADATQAETQEKLISLLEGKADTLVSDLSPNLSGIRFKDTYASYELALMVLNFAKKILKPGGNMVVKIFPGDELAGYKKQLQTSFQEVKTFIPEATRKSSTEIYLIGKKFHSSVS